MFVSSDLAGYLDGAAGACARSSSTSCARATARRIGDPRKARRATSTHRRDREQRLVAALARGLRTRTSYSTRRGRTRRRDCARSRRSAPGAPGEAARGGPRSSVGTLGRRGRRRLGDAARAISIAAASGVAPAASAWSSTSRDGVADGPHPRLGALGRVALGLELDRDVDDAAGVGDEVRHPEDAALRRAARPTASSASWLFAAPAIARQRRGGTVSSLRTPPSAHGASTSTSAVNADAGSDQRAPRSAGERRAGARRCRRRRARRRPRRACAASAAADAAEADDRDARPASDGCRTALAGDAHGGLDAERGPRARVAGAAELGRAGR